MEDIESEIAGEEVHDYNKSILDNKKKEDDNIRFSKRSNNSDKRNILIIMLISLVIIIIGFVLFLIFNKKDNTNNTVNNDEVKDVVKEEESGKKVFYVSCNDNTALLNVRNSISGDIIDGLSCFNEVDVLEEAGSTDTCDKWYRLSYKKHGNSYTGYSCAKYIKESSVDSIELNKIREVIDKVNKYYHDNQNLVYCGETSGTKNIEINEDGHTFNGQYLKSQFKSINELKEHILSFMDESLIKTKLEVSDYNNPKMFDNYYEIDGNLYCRNYSNKGNMTYYTDNYDIEVVNVSDISINVRIAYEYIDENKIDENDKCSVNSLSSCPNSYLKYIIKNITLSKNDSGNYIVTKMEYHD